MEGEATLEIDGAREVVHPGSRIGSHTVKSVTPGRIVLARAPVTPGTSSEQAEAGAPSTGTAGWREAPLVIVTFDASGEGKARAFWTSDPTARASAEAKRP